MGKNVKLVFTFSKIEIQHCWEIPLPQLHPMLAFVNVNQISKRRIPRAAQRGRFTRFPAFWRVAPISLTRFWKQKIHTLPLYMTSRFSIFFSLFSKLTMTHYNTLYKLTLYINTNIPPPNCKKSILQKGNILKSLKRETCPLLCWYSVVFGQLLTCA